MAQDGKDAVECRSMQFSLTREEFDRLLMLAYLGETVLNDWTTEGRHTPQQRAAMDVFADLCTRVGESGDKRMVQQDEASGAWLPTDAFHKVMEQILGAYDNEVFWDELVHRLAERDLDDEYGRATVDAMTESHRSHALRPLLDFYWNHVRANGMRGITVKDTTPKPPRARRTRRKKAQG